MTAAAFVTLACVALALSAYAVARVRSLGRVCSALASAQPVPSVMDGPRPWEVADPMALDCWLDYSAERLRCHSCPFAERCERETRAVYERVRDRVRASVGGDDE